MGSQAPPPLHPEAEPLAGLLGTWRGEGAGRYPTISPFRYGEEVRFFGRGERIARPAPGPAPSVVPARLTSPALNRSGSYPDNLTRRTEPRARRLCFAKNREDHGSFSSPVPSSSASHRRFTFF